MSFLGHALPGHHVDASDGSAESWSRPQPRRRRGRSEATSLDEGEASRRIQRVMARFVVRSCGDVTGARLRRPRTYP